MTQLEAIPPLDNVARQRCIAFVRNKITEMQTSDLPNFRTLNLGLEVGLMGILLTEAERIRTSEMPALKLPEEDLETEVAS